MHKTNFVHIFDVLADISSNCFLFSTAGSKIAQNINPLRKHGTETISPCIDISVNNVLFQTNPNFASCFLNS